MPWSKNIQLIAYHALNGETVFTFDKKVNKYLAAV